MLLFDSNNLAHIAKHSRGDLSFNGEGTGVIFGFLEDMKKFVMKFREPNEPIVFCWDSIKSIRKMDYFPNYKIKRYLKPKTDEEKDFDRKCYIQFNALRDDILRFIGFRNVFHQTGYESDDLIAKLVKDYPYPGDTVHSPKKHVTISTDDDLLQLLAWTNIYNPITKNMMTTEKFVSIYEINPDKWVEVKCLAGCSGDSVPNIPGVQIKTAIKYLTGGFKNKKSETYKTIEREKEEYYRQNRILVELPLPGVERMIISPDQFNLTNFIKVCDAFGFASFLKEEELDSWRKTFGG